MIIVAMGNGAGKLKMGWNITFTYGKRKDSWIKKNSFFLFIFPHLKQTEAKFLHVSKKSSIFDCIVKILQQLSLSWI